MESLPSSGPPPERRAVALNPNAKVFEYNPKSIVPLPPPPPIAPTTSRALAKRRIGTFFKTHRAKITSVYLARVCTDANECLAFARDEQQRIRSFFEFEHFTYAVGPVKMVNTQSAQGQIGIIRYSRNAYTALSLLKIMKKNSSDNLYYEFVVGSFVNKYLVPAFPCFTETYGLFLLGAKTTQALRRHTPTHLGQLTPAHLAAPNTPLSTLTTSADLLKNACAAGATLGIVTQYFDHAQTLEVAARNHPGGCAADALGILFQIYGPLGSIYDHFTHYDLHAGNVLLIPVPDGKYVHMHYRLAPGHEVSFKTRVVVKIIDQGRCFFRSPESGESSKTLSDLVCRSGACAGICGKESGFTLNPANPGRPVQVTPWKRNQAIDLLCAYRFLGQVRAQDSTGHLESVFARLPAIFAFTPYQIPDSYADTLAQAALSRQRDNPGSTGDTGVGMTPSVEGKVEGGDGENSTDGETFSDGVTGDPSMEDADEGPIGSVTDLAVLLWNKLASDTHLLQNNTRYANAQSYGSLYVSLANHPGSPLQPMRWGGAR